MKVRVKPVKGCCNSTLCFQEWDVIDMISIRVKGHSRVVYVCESDGDCQIFFIEQCEEIVL